jgi:signal transduction histidine kinase
MPADAFWHRDDSGGTNLIAGLRVDCFEGSWENAPDFNLLNVVKSGSVPNLGTDFCTQREFVGLRFTGFFLAPAAGEYTFNLASDDGALLFIGEESPQVRVLNHVTPPSPTPASANQVMTVPADWVTVEGRIGFVSRIGRGFELELHTSTGILAVRVVDAAGLDPAQLLQARVCVAGVAISTLTLDNKRVFGRLVVCFAGELKVVADSLGADGLTNVLTTAEQVQRLGPEAAARHLPVRIRGVVTSTLERFYRGLSIEDDTRGIYADLHGVSDAIGPVAGEIWEVTGHTIPGDFAPMVYAEQLKLRGPGELPEPARPTWNQLINGSMDAQWVEIQGVVTEVSSNQLTLLLPERMLRAKIDAQNESSLKPLLGSHVRIHGVLFAEWSAQTHDVRPGQILLRNASISVDHHALADVFNAPLKTVAELLRFDIDATAFQPVKVQGRVVYSDSRQFYLMDGNVALMVLPTDSMALQPGDTVEAVGYPEISGLSPVLREAVVRKMGAGPLPEIQALKEADILNGNHVAALVGLTGKLLGWHFEVNSLVLEMQTGRYLYAARLAAAGNADAWLRIGSQLRLTGVFVAQTHGRQLGQGLDGFELLLNSPADLKVLSQPAWWTLPRLLALVGVLLAVLILATLWITQLRRQVEQRTGLLQHEIRERERAERQHALEAERSRIARDLHDDLGSSLTEIGVLASKGGRNLPAGNSPGLFRSIGEKARGLIAALDVIVWAVDPEQNTLQFLADYLGSYAEEYMTNAGIACRFKIPAALPPVTLDGCVRHDLFLAIKESLHNIVQHSHATEVEFHLAVTGSDLEIVIADNGCGFVPCVSDGHGLKNLLARMERMGGHCEVLSQANQGTQVKMFLPLLISSVTK